MSYFWAHFQNLAINVGCLLLLLLFFYAVIYGAQWYFLKTTDLRAGWLVLIEDRVVARLRHTMDDSPFLLFKLEECVDRIGLAELVSDSEKGSQDGQMKLKNLKSGRVLNDGQFILTLVGADDVRARFWVR